MNISNATRQKMGEYVELSLKLKFFIESGKWIFDELETVCSLERKPSLLLAAKIGNQTFGYIYNSKNSANVGGGYSVLSPDFGDGDLKSALLSWKELCAKYNHTCPVFKKLPKALYTYDTDKEYATAIDKVSCLSAQLQDELSAVIRAEYGGIDGKTGEIVIIEYSSASETQASFIFKFSYERRNMGWKQINARNELNVHTHLVAQKSKSNVGWGITKLN